VSFGSPCRQSCRTCFTRPEQVGPSARDLGPVPGPDAARVPTAARRPGSRRQWRRSRNRWREPPSGPFGRYYAGTKPKDSQSLRAGWGKLGQVEEIADFVVFLLSDRSGVVTGSVIDWDQNVLGGLD